MLTLYPWRIGTYSNVSNHPRLLRVRDATQVRVPKIKLDPKTGFPIVEEDEAAKRAREEPADAEMEDESASDDDSREFPGQNYQVI